jgi:hypothetical protein
MHFTDFRRSLSDTGPPILNIWLWPSSSVWTTLAAWVKEATVFYPIYITRVVLLLLEMYFTHFHRSVIQATARIEAFSIYAAVHFNAL